MRSSLKNSLILVLSLFGIFCKGPSELSVQKKAQSKDLPIKLSVISNLFKDSIEEVSSGFLKNQNKIILSDLEYRNILTQGFADIFSLEGRNRPESEQDIKSNQQRAEPLAKNLIIRAFFSVSSNNMALDSLSYKCYTFPGKMIVSEWRMMDTLLKKNNLPNAVKILVEEFISRNY